MTKDETNKEIQKHIYNVKKIINKIRDELYYRGHDHDQSKMVTPEVEIFAEYTDKLKSTTYGSEDYKQYLKDMKPALDHHYNNNRHHPEHFDNGIDDMNLIDVIEMVCDWKAATKRHNDGDFIKSVKYNTNRFGLSKQLAAIIINTADILEEGFEVKNEKS